MAFTRTCSQHVICTLVLFHINLFMCAMQCIKRKALFFLPPNVIGYGREENIFFVPMHSGIWTICIDLTQHELNELTRNGLPPTSQCVNYLTENAEYARHDELKFEQHGEYQVTRRPSLSK